MISLERDFPKESMLAAKLYGFMYAGTLPVHLNRIYDVTELKWEENMQRLVRNNAEIKYLVIGEAAPETLSGEVSYFYNNCHGNWCKAIVEGIIPREEVPIDVEQKLEMLSQRQFLLVDTMPFAINYSIANRRGRKVYKELVASCANSYFCKKLFDPRLKWSEVVKVAFGVKKNAMAMIEAFPDGFSLPNGQIVQFDLEQVATTQANYPHADKLRNIFDLLTD